LVDKEKKRSIPVRLIRSERSLIIVLFFRGDGQKYPIMNFGKALELMKSGNKLSRKGWNGKNMFAVYQ
ncbi:DUF2829 domain-containing protein, partial [Bacillus thuringiensis]|uniref:DUF2829 domain-containing protein n=1 Tax=Bacillus thuringiensis TaxID=1428 RepID=UPI00211E0CF4